MVIRLSSNRWGIVMQKLWLYFWRSGPRSRLRTRTVSQLVTVPLIWKPNVELLVFFGSQGTPASTLPCGRDRSKSLSSFSEILFIVSSSTGRTVLGKRRTISTGAHPNQFSRRSLDIVSSRSLILNRPLSIKHKHRTEHCLWICRRSEHAGRRWESAGVQPLQQCLGWHAQWPFPQHAHHGWSLCEVGEWEVILVEQTQR
jgi:hypothetical protein